MSLNTHVAASLLCVAEPAFTLGDLRTRVKFNQDVVRLQVPVRNSVTDEVVHTLQELQNHHRGKTNIRVVLAQVLAQRAGVTRQNKGQTPSEHPRGSLLVVPPAWGHTVHVPNSS